MTEEHSSSGDPTVASNAHSLRKAIAEMKAEISKKQELLRKLHMVKTHRIKNSENSIEDLISQWRSAARGPPSTDLSEKQNRPTDVRKTRRYVEKNLGRVTGNQNPVRKPIYGTYHVSGRFGVTGYLNR
uniref:Swi5-dependent recombination DNA repair protein 1 homolog n=1 Tax=Ixodes ricinus TaxID=34613 RepID=A0A0K8RAX8_IXORI